MISINTKDICINNTTVAQFKKNDTTLAQFGKNETATMLFL